MNVVDVAAGLRERASDARLAGRLDLADVLYELAGALEEFGARDVRDALRRAINAVARDRR